MTAISVKKIAIVGPTASGKTTLSLQISQQYNGEIINADSRNVYIGMDIGTAKPTEKERNLVKHHLLDIRKPDKRYSASEFKTDALLAIAKIESVGKLPVVVGATGLYVDALLFDYQFPESQSRRDELEAMALDELLVMLKKLDPAALERIDTANLRRVIRAVETLGASGQKKAEIDKSWLVIGINPGKEILYKNVTQRAHEQLKSGLITETEAIIKDYGEHIESLNTVPYRQVIAYLHGELSAVDLPQKIATANWQLARRQMTWFKRNKQIQWVATPEEGMDLASRHLYEV